MEKHTCENCRHYDDEDGKCYPPRPYWLLMPLSSRTHKQDGQHCDAFEATQRSEPGASK